MSSLQRLVITSNGTALDFKSFCNLAPGQIPALNNFIDYLGGISAGAIQGAALAFKVGAVQASGTITQTSTGAANSQTCTICGITFTAKTSGATGNEWNRDNDVSISAANLAAAINASASLTGIVTATALVGVVTVKAVVPGLIGNGLVMANVNLANTTIVSFAAGTDGTAYNLNFA